MKGPGILAGSPLWPRAPPVLVVAVSLACSRPKTAGLGERNPNRGLKGRDHAQKGGGGRGVSYHVTRVQIVAWTARPRRLWMT